MTAALRWNPKKQVYAYIDGEAKTAKEIGLTKSLSAGPNTWFTDDEYAALALWDIADGPARERLARFRAEWEASRRKDWTGTRHLQPDNVSLFPYQEAGVAYALERRHALLGDMPGLGKTGQAIVVANEMKARRVLVVCPASVRRQWAIEIRTWSVQTRPHIYIIEKSADGVAPDAAWTILSYELARGALRPVLERGEWDLVILDEAHYLKTPDAQRTRALFGGGDGAWPGIATRAAKVLALTGTPLPNRPRECYTLTRALCWDAIDWASYDAFTSRFNPSFFGYELTGRLPELQNRLRCNLLVRRIKQEVLTQLPEVRYELTYVDKTADIRRTLAAEALLDIDPTDLSKVPMDMQGEISTLRRQMGEAMAPQVAQHVHEVIDGGRDKIVLFGHHRSVLDLLEAALAKHGVVRIDGSTSGANRALAINRFVNDPGVKIILGNLQSMGTGVNGLQQAASLVLFAEASWVMGENQQAVDRLHRIGQRDAVLARFLVAEGSFAEKIISTALKKEKNVHAVLDKGVSVS